ncbi:MAG: leucine-rich repeat protein [Muribaculaceae bacterium]|nr:leucine-rich repeat protein [Muribaculaceae bacterium]
MNRREQEELFKKTPLLIPGDVKRIEANSMGFKHCSEIIIGEGVEEIGGWAFTCSVVDSATIPSSVKKIEENPFPHTHICDVKCESPYYTVKDDILIENETMRMVSFVGIDRYSGRYPWGRAENERQASQSQKYESLFYTYRVPSYIKVLGEGCFRGRILDRITIPETVEKILQNPFVECGAEIENHSPNYQLKNGLLTENATNTLIAYVGHDKDIIVPEGVEIIEGSAFELLGYGVNSITLPRTVIEIRDNFAEGCELKHIYVPEDKEDFFRELLPQYKDIISVASAAEREAVAAEPVCDFAIKIKPRKENEGDAAEPVAWPWQENSRGKMSKMKRIIKELKKLFR